MVFRKVYSYSEMMSDIAQGNLNIRIHRNITGEMFDAKVLIKRWRMKYNIVRPHSALGYLPPAPEAVESIQTVSTTFQ